MNSEGQALRLADARSGRAGRVGRAGQPGQARQAGRAGRVGQVGRAGQAGQQSACGHAGTRARNATGFVLPLIFVAFVSSWFGPTFAQDARAIVAEAQRRTEAASQRYEGVLQVFNAKGAIADKRWMLERLGSHGRSRMVLRFTAPAEVKGVAMLVVNHPDRASDQWMWTPAIERDRRIALQDRSTQFFGTDFSFEDLEERDVDQFDYTLLGEEAIDGVPCWKIQSVPKKGKTSQYTRSMVWIRKDNYVLARVESYVRDQAARRLNYTDFQNVQGIWTARVLEMSNLRRGSRTRLTLDKLEYNLPLKEENFTLQALRRQ